MSNKEQYKLACKYWRLIRRGNFILISYRRLNRMPVAIRNAARESVRIAESADND